jgi:hypothetical protein
LDYPGRSFSDWMKPGARGDLMEIIYVGPNSANPDQAIYKRDLNNFGPAVGFAWNIPGADKVQQHCAADIRFSLSEAAVDS